MQQLNHHDYYRARAQASRELAQQSADPSIAAIHAEFAARYDVMFAEAKKQGYGAVEGGQAT